MTPGLDHAEEINLIQGLQAGAAVQSHGETVPVVKNHQVQYHQREGELAKVCQDRRLQSREDDEGVNGLFPHVLIWRTIKISNCIIQTAYLHPVTI